MTPVIQLPVPYQLRVACQCGNRWGVLRPRGRVTEVSCALCFGVQYELVAKKVNE